tara:strand:- start:3414 stop:4160 length:747 start_codon:yes stop_codon:yes gene_type:complete
MKIILSPAKKLDFSKHQHERKGSGLIFPTKTKKIIRKMKSLSVKELGELMKLSPQLSDLNFQRYQLMGEQSNEISRAAEAFNGEVYTGLDFSSFTAKNLESAQEKLRILSGLYGILKPDTIIEPYRLEMGTKLNIEASKNLYDFWGDDILQFLKTEESDTIVNLASTEYSKAAKLKQFKGLVITPHFKDFKNGDYKVIMMYAKKARGKMANWIIKNDISKANDIKNFIDNEYIYNEGLSSDKDWVFTR